MAVVIWTKFAQQTLYENWEFIAKTDLKYANFIADKIIEASLSLKFTKQFQVEESLGEPYRRIIYRNYKIIYVVKENLISIVRVFDTRQDPNKLSLK